MNKKIIQDLKYILKNYILLLIPVLILLLAFFHYTSKIEFNKNIELILEEQKTKANMIDYILNDICEDIHEDLMIIRYSNEIFDYTNNNSEKTFHDVESFFERMLTKKKSFLQLRLIDIKGQELIRVENIDGTPKLLPINQLQNNINKKYYSTITQLKDGELYVSPMDLSLENKEVKKPYTPLIRFSTPLYSNTGEFKGIIIINYSGQDFLNIFYKYYKDLNSNFIRPILINSDGYYLYNCDPRKLFGFMYEGRKEETVATENLELWNELSNKKDGIYENDNYIYYFQRVYPLLKTPSSKVDNYYWTIISEISTKDLPIYKKQSIFYLKTSELIILISISILLLIIVAIFYFLKRDKTQLALTENIAENTSDAVIITDSKTNIIYANNAFEKATGYSREEVIGLKPSNFKSNKHTSRFYKKMWESINRMGLWQGELWDKRKDGMLYPKKLTILAIKNKSNNIVSNYIGIFSDLTDIKETLSYTIKVENYNLETNLPNEHLLINLIKKSINESTTTLFIIYFSIENYFNIIADISYDNKSFVNIFINNIKNMLTDNDFIAQTSKNKFVIGITSLNSKNELHQFVNSFLRTSKKPIYFIDKEIYFDIKVGIACYPDDGVTANELTTNANIALTFAINSKGEKHKYYNSSFKNLLQKESEIDSLLRKAIQHNELSIYYQPQIEIESGQIVGAEALLRWNNNQLGNISPIIFIPIAEKTGQIIEIGYWVIEKVFEDINSFKEKINSNFRFSINISPLQFKDKQLFINLENLIDKYNIDPNMIEIEITESVLMTDLNIINNQLQIFKNLGITIAIDDFGTGFSSLSYLKALNIDKLKIDRNFIKDYPTKDNGEMAEVIINLANKLHLKVITEGAETLEQIEFLQSKGCNLIQGYYYSKPLPTVDFNNYMNNFTTKAQCLRGLNEKTS